MAYTEQDREDDLEKVVAVLGTVYALGAAQAQGVDVFDLMPDRALMELTGPALAAAERLREAPEESLLPSAQIESNMILDTGITLRSDYAVSDPCPDRETDRPEHCEPSQLAASRPVR